MFLQNNHYIQNKRICSILITFTLKTSCVCVVFFRIYLNFFFFVLFLFSLKRKFQVCREKGDLKCFEGEKRGMRRG